MTTTTAAQGHSVPDDAALYSLVERSHEVITGLQHAGGAYPACPTFSAYAGYAWLRDGSFTAEGVSRYGDAASAERFHDWVSGVLVTRTGQVAELIDAVGRGAEPPAEKMLPTRFVLDGRDGTEPWWDFQTDGFGTWLWSVVTHARRHGADLDRWRAGIEVCVDYLTAFWSRPCYDWWEEHLEQRHTSTLGAIYGGLTAAASCGLLDPRREEGARAAAEGARRLALTQAMRGDSLAKWLGSDAVDGSLPACVVPFGLLSPDDPRAGATLDAVAGDLDVGGGVHRFTADVFYGGGQWPLLSALLGWNRAVAGDTDAAWRYLRWVAAQLTPAGELPEQVGHHLLAPEHRTEWIEHWGPIATPLLWSHGMYLILADELGLVDGAARRPA